MKAGRHPPYRKPGKDAPRIAILESDDLIRELMIRWLQEAGYVPVPIDAAVLPTPPPLALVIANIAEPREATGLLRRLQPLAPTPILLISARFRRGLPRAATLAMATGAAGVLPKPFTRGEMLAAVAATALAHPARPRAD